MKCLVIHGSPRRGNTWEVLNIAKEEMLLEGDFEFEVVELAKGKIPMCLGCFNCISNGEDKCPHKFAMESIVSKMEEADAFIITSPVYSMQVSALLKNFIDHMSYNFHRSKFYRKKVFVITTTAGAGHKSTANYIKNIMYYWGVNYVETLPIAYRSYILTDKNKLKTKKAAKSFAKELKSKKLHQPSLKAILMFNLWRSMSLKGDEFLIADNKYWSSEELVNSSYFPGIPVGTIKRLTGKIIGKLLK